MKTLMRYGKKDTDGATVKPQVTLAENSYDELGRLKTNKKNNQANLNTTYAYNIRSWTNSITNAHFNEALTCSYNGNISSMQWVQAGKTRKYNFTYDNLSRLKTATYTGDGNFNTAYSYDKHGNMLTLQRYGLTASATYGQIDNLTMTYTGNQMKTVNDAAADIALNTSMDFKNYSNVATEYTYNRNGAMTQDLNKGISSISYNSLNLPRMVDIKNKTTEGRNEYTYSASGQKLKAVQKWNPNYSTTPVIGSTVNTAALTQSQITDYVGNIIYENNALKRILVDGGYIENGNYYFYITDHLGNNRIVTDAAASVVQSTQYYPFGSSFADASGTSTQPYKYNGKELDARNGLNMYDYSARYKDDFRFTTVDPLAEKYYSWSPYAYVMNNPLKYIDPDGRKIIFIVRDGSKSGQQYTYSNGNFHKSNGDVYHPKEGTTMFKTLVAYKTMGLLNDKTLQDQLSTLENSDLNHFIEEAKPGEGSSVRTFVPGKTSEEMEQMEKDGVPMGTMTVLNFSKESQDEFKKNNGVEKTPLTTVTHEQKHQHDYNQGTMTDNDRSKGAKNPAEKRAVDNENRVRPKDKRTKYAGEDVN